MPKDETNRETCRFSTRGHHSEPPLPITVRSFAPCLARAAKRLWGVPEPRNPPTATVAPSKTSATASSRLRTVLSIRAALLRGSRGPETRTRGTIILSVPGAGAVLGDGAAWDRPGCAGPREDGPDRAAQRPARGWRLARPDDGSAVYLANGERGSGGGLYQSRNWGNGSSAMTRLS